MAPRPPRRSRGRVLPAPGRSFTPLTPTDGAMISHAPGQIVTQLPTSDCLSVTTTPLIIDEYAVFATHKESSKPSQTGGPNSGCDLDPTQPGLYAVSTRTGEAFTLAGEVDVEGTPTYAGGNAYVIANDPYHGMNETLYKIDLHCGVSALFQSASATASTPTLADDRYVLVAADGVLHVIDRRSGAAKD